MLSFEELDIIAREVAATAPGWQRWDVYQECWLRFLRYPPRTFGGAHLMSRHARNDLWRSERRHTHTDIDDVPDEALHDGGDDPTTDTAITRTQLATVPREIVRIAIASERGAKPDPAGVCVRDRVRLHRWRKSQVQEGEKR
jgi:hypothetical protein